MPNDTMNFDTIPVPYPPMRSEALDNPDYVFLYSPYGHPRRPKRKYEYQVCYMDKHKNVDGTIINKTKENL